MTTTKQSRAACVTAARAEGYTGTDAEFSSVDLRAEAKKAIARGEDVECHRGVYRSPGDADADIRVETLVLENGRAGQTTNGDAVWGDWDAETQTITADDGSVYDLDAGEIE